jgi:peptide/nickel transport system substrate-binding protein
MRRLRRGSWVTAVLVSCLALVAAGCGDDDGDGDASTTTSVQIVEGGTVRVALEEAPTGWNPGTSSDNSLVLANIVAVVYPSVFAIQPDFTVKLDRELMVSATQVADSPQTIEYVIQPDAAWSDGTPISADDFVYAWEQQNGSNEDNDVAATTGYEDIESVTPSEGGKKVTVVFSTPFTDWQGLFSNLLPAHVMKTIEGGWNDGLDGASFPKFSGGPFEVSAYTDGESATLVPNDAYFGPKPHLESIVLQFGIEAAALPDAFENDEIDLAYPQPQADLVQQFEQLEPGVVSEVNYGLDYEHIDFNLDNSFLKDAAVRKAIAHGLDRDAIVARTVKQFDARGQRLDNRIWMTGQPEHEAHGTEYQARDVAAAKKALTDAGWAAGDDGIMRKGGQKLSLRITTIGGNPLRQDTEELIQAQLKEAGIEIVIDNAEDGPTFGGRVFPKDPGDKDFDIALFAWTSDPFASTHVATFSTDGGNNETGYSNPQVDDLFERAISNPDRQAAVAQLNQIDEILWQDLPTIPLYTKPTFLPYRATFVNIKDNATTRGPLWNAHEWAMTG